ncbi:glycosyltransferase [Actinopolymorpha rutila]|uniref:4,4'-diaponeurosporenoate glycosyltransferase n=1 Tax=Actinopolymorpha rutila TaxID=446787 RepID=A0A852ZRT4_9ACTN|nr:glycosyltransferase involved in cell wall biosynthesis [Actinopolymorpha rutila]
MSSAVRGSVIIPAHDEASNILRTLEPLRPLMSRGLQVIVVPNGCKDRTAELARSIPGVQVIELSRGSKTAALNAGDEAATSWPRLYLDADIAIGTDTVAELLERLSAPGALAGRPHSGYLTAGCSALVRAYYRARERMPELSAHLWGAGAYALTEAGHARVGRFPDVVADDVYVDSKFDRTEITFGTTGAAVVRCPRNARALLRTLRRVRRGPAGLAAAGIVEASSVQVGGLRLLLSSVHSVAELADAVVYAGFVLLARIQPTQAADRPWERDDTQRAAAA